MHSLKRVVLHFHCLAFSCGQVKMIQILFENGENNLWLQKYLDTCGQDIDRHIEMTCHEHHSVSCITLKPKHIHLQESLFPFVHFFVMYSVHGLIVEFYNKLNFHTMLTEHFVCGFKQTLSLRACLHGGGGPQIGEVTHSGSPNLPCKRDQIEN